MKIAKKSIKAEEKNPIRSEETKPVDRPEYVTCMRHIKAAIDILGPSAKSDARARDTIANLGVVLLDLRSK